MTSSRFYLSCLLVLAVVIGTSSLSSAKSLVIFGLDDTGSYGLRAKGVEVGNMILDGLKDGDVFYARRITDKSFHDSASIFRLEVPVVGNAPTNRFNRVARGTWEKKIQQARAIKTQAKGILSRLKPVKAPRTDIWGFLAACEARFLAEEGGSVAAKKIIIASDMKDNVKRKVHLDLQGADILIVGFESGADPEATQKLQAAWIDSLLKAKAGNVRFLPPDTRMALNP
ncbi:MAG: hypothetical protein AB2L22_12895 [Syntrophales bacterium]